MSAAVASASRQNELQQRQAIRVTNARQAAKRWAAAVVAHNDGDVQSASRMIVTTLNTSFASEAVREEGRGYLDQYRTEGEDKLKRLVSLIVETQPNEEPEEQRTRVGDAIMQLRELSRKYQHVNPVNKEIARRLDYFVKSDELVGQILYEPEAIRLVKIGRACERDGHACCAYLFYEQAAKQMPCETARKAKMKVRQMATDSSLLEAVQKCRTIRMCQEKYDRAVRMADGKSLKGKNTARKLLQQIVTESPKSSEINKASAKQLAMLENKVRAE